MKSTEDGKNRVVTLLDEAGKMISLLADTVRTLNAALPAGVHSNGDTDVMSSGGQTLIADEEVRIDFAKRYFMDKYGLTSREIEVFQLFAKGLTGRQVAAALNITDRTAACHWINIRTKLGSRSTAELIALAVKHGLVQVHD